MLGKFFPTPPTKQKKTKTSSMCLLSPILCDCDTLFTLHRDRVAEFPPNRCPSVRWDSHPEGLQLAQPPYPFGTRARQGL